MPDGINCHNHTIINHVIDFADHNTTSIMERIPARMTMAHVKIPIDDELYENDETFQVVITSTSGSDGSVIIGIINSTRIIIVDNDEIDIYFQRSVYEFSEKIEKNEVPIHARLPMLGSQAEVVLKIQVTEENAISECAFISVEVTVISVKTEWWRQCLHLTLA